MHACADDTIITWLDADVGTDVALSFQETDGCTQIWGTIQGVHTSDGAPTSGTSTAHGKAESTDGTSGGCTTANGGSGSGVGGAGVC